MSSGQPDPASSTDYAEPAVETGYPTGTEYASTGTGTPVVVEEEYPAQTPPANRDYPGGQR